MPRGDRTGPEGIGSMTGRSAGYCAGYQVPGYANPVLGRGWFGFGRYRGRGRGYGWFGWRRGFRGWYGGAARLPYWGRAYFDYHVPYENELSPKDEVVMLKEEAELLRKQQEDIKKRIDILEKAQKQEEKGE